MKKRAIFLLASILFATQLCGCATGAKADDWKKELLRIGPGLFSWSKKTLDRENAERMFDRMQSCGLSSLYQYFPSDVSDEDLDNFFELALEYDISVYYLTGSPDWALDPDGKEMCDEVEQAAVLNERLTGRGHLTGIFMDTEPYLLDEWEDAADKIMDTYISAMECAHDKAGKKGLSYIACVPFYYDDMGYEQELKELLATGCDTLAIMNYSKRDEAGQIETEITLAMEADRPVIVIYELQEPGSYGLKEVNTYYQDGLSAVAQSVENLKERYGEDSFRYALHEYKALQEMMERE